MFLKESLTWFSTVIYSINQTKKGKMRNEFRLFWLENGKMTTTSRE